MLPAGSRQARLSIRIVRRGQFDLYDLTRERVTLLLHRFVTADHGCHRYIEGQVNFFSNIQSVKCSRWETGLTQRPAHIHC